ncbi:MAG: transglutaminase, partial [Christiangramia sp.]
DNLNTYAAFLDWELQYTKFPNSTVKNYSETWEGVTKSIYSDIGIENELNRDNFYNDELDEIIAGLSDPMMKAEKIFNYVKQTVKWNDYLGFFPDNGTKKAFKEGSGNTGDINLLLISMLKYANLKAYPILLSTPSNGVPLFPTRDGFNYIIAGLEIDGNIVLLDATDPMTGIGELPKRARNWQGRLIKEKGESAWVNLMPNYLSENSIKMNYKFDGSKIVGWNRNDYSRLFAKDFRTEHGDSEVKNNIEKRIQGISGIEISDYKAENKNKLGSEITESFEFELSSAAESIGDKIYFQPLLFEALSENPFKSEERIYPVFFDFPEIKSYTINIMIPDGYKIVSLPESLALRLGEDDGEFKFIINGNGNVIRLISNVTLKKTAYLAEEYKFLKKFYANIIKKHSEAIVLEKIKQDGNIERTESGR